MKIFSSILICFITFFLSTQSALAHVVVKPAEVGVATRQNFVVSVPTEEDIPTTQVRLLIPEGLKSVRPNVKPGWNIELIKTGEGETTRISEIIWSGGSIPAEQRDEFVFSAQVPAEPTEINWKAYQTYADGAVVAWDTDPAVVEEYTKNNPPKDGEHDDAAPKPFSVTMVVDDLAPTTLLKDDGKKSSFPLILSVTTLIISLVALTITLRKRK